MKQRIRLTESDLHRVIKESVRQVLSELDWRTYHSAYEKASEQGDHKRALKFRQAADNAFNREHGYGMKNIPFGDGDMEQIEFSDGEIYGGGHCYTPNGEQFGTVSGKMDQNNEIDKIYTNQSIHTHDTRKGVKRGDNNPHNDMQVNATGVNPMRKAKQMKGDKEVRDYFNGKTQYVKGKGYQ